jgi:anti-sigma regulatory factor (Ser/Thr protein kinase)/tetratricopeptide (TPR) repeat protein
MNKFFALLFICVFICLNFCNADDCKCSLPYKLSHDKSKDEIVISNLLQSKNKVCIAKANELKFSILFEKNELDSAEEFLKQAEKIYQSINCNESIKADLYELWAGFYYQKSDFETAQKYSFKYLASAEASGNAFDIATCNTMIAQLFNQTNQAENGILYTRNAVKYLPKLNNLDEKRQILHLISKRYLWHFQDTKKMGSLDSSELYAWQQLKVAKQIGNNNSISKAFSNLEGAEYERGNFKKALIYLDSAFKYIANDKLADKRVNYFDKADLCIEMKDYKEAVRYSDSSLYYDKLLKIPAYISESYLLKSRIAELQNDFKTAYEYKDLARTITDSISNVDRTAAVTELEKKYNQAKNENTIKDLAQKQQLYLMLAIIGLFAALAFAFYLRQQSLKHKKDILETEQRLNRARMNPHFFFNALTSLQKFALSDGNGEAMASNLSKFSNIMRETLESTYKEYVTIEQEIDFLNEYMEVQKMRFPTSFTYEINAANDVEIDEVLIPSMIIQPFVENAIEHGFSGIEYAGKMNIDFKKNDTEILIEIIDNGKGLNTLPKENNDHISRASQIIKDRIYLLNIKLKTKAGFSIDNNNDKGVIVKIHLPLLYKNELKD